jgi:general secretion pathway protein H
MAVGGTSFPDQPGCLRGNAVKRAYFTARRTGRTLAMKHMPGFTLIEVILVLFIIAVSIGLLVPRIGAGWKNMNDRDFLQDFIGTMKRARLNAMSGGEIVAFRIRGSDRTYDLVNPPRKPIPENVDIYADKLEQDPWTRDEVILFYPDGSVSGSDLEIRFDQQRAFHIAIHPLFGTVHYYKVEAH